METWRKCSTCKDPIGFGGRYWACSVSTCNRKRTGLVFCSVECWDAHLPVVRHREAWSEEKTVPTREQWERELAEEASPSPKSPPKPKLSQPKENRSMSDTPNEVLVVVSKLKAYIKSVSAMNTSADVMPALSDKIRRLCDDAIETAKSDGRKTVMARDFS